MVKKRAPLGKEQIAQQLDAVRKKGIVRDKFYPALTAATVSVDEAKMLIHSISTLIMEEAMMTLREKKMSEIEAKLLKRLCPDGDQEKEVKELLAVFSGESLFTTRELTEGMSQAIEYMIQTDMRNRTLNSFEPNWDLMLTK